MDRDEPLQPNLDRRRFLGGAAGTLALGATGLAACSAPTSDEASDGPARRRGTTRSTSS